MPEEFDLEHQYQLYLKRVALKEETMNPTQKKQLKQTFMGACGQMLILLRDDLTKLSEEKSTETLQSMLDQVGNFFLKQTDKLN